MMNPQQLSISLLTLCAFSTLVSAPAKAQTAAITFDSMVAQLNTDRTIGWSFNVTAPSGINVIGLSVFDLGLDGFSSAHQVGIWSPSGTLLASVTMPTGTVAPFDSSGLYRYVGITPLTLPQGNNYIVGASYGASNADGIAYRISGTTTAPGVFQNNGGLMNVGSSLTRPTTDYGTFTNFGGGGSFVVGAAPSASAPEPGTLSLLALGLLVPFVRRARR